MRKYDKTNRQPTSLTSALVRWVAGFGVYLLVAATMRLWVDQASQIPKIEAIAIAIMFSVSLVLIISSTLSIVLKLRSDLRESGLAPQQRLVGSLALGSLTGAVLALFISWFSTAALVLGLISLRQSYLQDNAGLKDMRAYRSVSLISIAAATASVFLTAIIAYTR